MTGSTVFVDNLRHVPSGPAVVTVGTFDGMHLGHRALLDAAERRSLDLGVGLVVVTFEPVPAMVLRPDAFRGRIVSAEEKRRLLSAGGGRTVVILPFTRSFAGTSPETFMTDLASSVDIREFWVGEEFALGRDRSGTTDRLRDIGRDLGFEVHAMRRVELDGGVVSSSRIRTAIEVGDIELATLLLGRHFAITGPVCEGAKLGRTIGFPTANVMPVEDLVSLADGIYATLAEIEGDARTWPAMTYIGTRPALNPGPRVIETHLFDFSDDIYNRVLTTRFVHRLRPDRNFPSVDALIAQMRQDEVSARSILATNR